MGELRESKKRETRERLSDIATELFFARGFDAVTVEEIAAAAKVSKVTVFNYFARKEDLFFDREHEVKDLVRTALGNKPAGTSSLEALRSLVDTLREEKHPLARIDEQTVKWWRVAAASPALCARLREFGDETVAWLAVELFGAKADGVARLVAGMVVVAWRTAYAEAIRAFESGGSAKKVDATFMALLERGFAAAASTTSAPRSRSAR